MSDENVPVHPVIVTSEFEDWVHAQPRIVEFRFPDPDTCEIAGMVVPGRYEEEFPTGFTVFANDGVNGGWAEYYYDLAVAVARVAALAEAVDHDTFFKDTPEDFAQHAQLFLNGVTASDDGKRAIT